MDKEEKDLPEVQETTEEEVEQTTEESQELTPEEVAELKRNAEVSSQNYERAKKAEQKAKEYEARIKELEALETTDEFDTDDDAVRKEVRELNKKLAAIEEKAQMETVLSQHPNIKEFAQEFDEFKEEYQGFPLDKVAKLFIAEKGINETTKRKGLEKAGGGTRTPSPDKMTSDDVKRLRETNFREYKKLLQSGKLKI